MFEPKILSQLNTVFYNLTFNYYQTQNKTYTHNHFI